MKSQVRLDWLFSCVQCDEHVAVYMELNCTRYKQTLKHKFWMLSQWGLGLETSISHIGQWTWWSYFILQAHTGNCWMIWEEK